MKVSFLRLANFEFFSAVRTRANPNTPRLRSSKENPNFTQTHKTKNKIRKNALDAIFLLAWVFVSIVVSQIVIGVIMRIILGDAFDSPLWMAVYTATIYVLTLFLVIFVPKKIKKLKLATSRDELGLKDLPRWRDIGLAAAGFVVYFVLAGLLVALFSLFPWFDPDEVQDIGFAGLANMPERILALISLVFVAPIAEEIIFRGWLYDKLRSRVGIWLAILLVSVLFGLAHGTWNVGINVFALSVVMCLIRELTGTIYGGMILHILKNAVAFYLLLYTGVL